MYSEPEAMWLWRVSTKLEQSGDFLIGLAWKHYVGKTTNDDFRDLVVMGLLVISY